MSTNHQYIDRDSGRCVTEHFFHDRYVRYLYSHAREKAPALFNALTGPVITQLVGIINYDLPLAGRLSGNMKFLKQCGVDLLECIESPGFFTTMRRIFERKINYEKYRPLAPDDVTVVSPADSRMVTGSLCMNSVLFLKDKFFHFKELFGENRQDLHDLFREGDYGIFRLTPDKYHYNHSPVSGVVSDYYLIPGGYHSCNPGAVVEIATPYSKNRREVTIINTDVEGGTGIGYIAMIEIAALMIGNIVQCYSSRSYDSPIRMTRGLWLEKGRPKSLFRPGSSTTVLIFQKDRILFSNDIIRNRMRSDAESDYSRWLSRPLVETGIKVRSEIARRLTD